MAALAHRPAVSRMVHETFTVWRCTSLEWNSAEPEMLGRGMDFDGAVKIGELNTAHKAKFIVRRENDQSGAVTLHVYVMKQGKPVWRKAASDMAHAIQVRPTYAEHVTDIALTGALVRMAGVA